MSLTLENKIYNNYNISSNMSRNISYRLKRSNNILDKLNEADEEIKTNIFKKVDGRRKKQVRKKKQLIEKHWENKSKTYMKIEPLSNPTKLKNINGFIES